MTNAFVSEQQQIRRRIYEMCKCRVKATIPNCIVAHESYGFNMALFYFDENYVVLILGSIHNYFNNTEILRTRKNLSL